MSLSVLNGCARCPLVEEIDACIRQDRQAKMHSDTDCGHILLITRYSYFVQRVNISKIIFMYLQQKLLKRLKATTAILSRMCRQVWIGTFGICRLHARAPIPMQTNTHGISRCTDRYIRHMQTSAPTVSHVKAGRGPQPGLSPGDYGVNTVTIYWLMTSWYHHIVVLLINDWAAPQCSGSRLSYIIYASIRWSLMPWHRTASGNQRPPCEMSHITWHR